jgi:hypothetical protein
MGFGWRSKSMGDALWGNFWKLELLTSQLLQSLLPHSHLGQHGPVVSRNCPVRRPLFWQAAQ